MFFIFASLTPLYALLFLDSQANSAILENQQLLNLTSRSVSLSAQVDDQLSEWSKDTKLLAGDPEILRLMTGDGSVADEAGGTLRRIQQSDPAFKVAFLMDPTGTVVQSTDPALTGSTELASNQFFQSAKAGNSAISDLSIGHLAPVPAIYFAAPVRDAVGSVHGVAALRVSPDKIFSFFKTDLLGQERYGLLLDQYGIVIGTSGPQKVLYHSLSPLNETDQQTLK